jgi:hypothetical protein
MQAIMSKLAASVPLPGTNHSPHSFTALAAQSQINIEAAVLNQLQSNTNEAQLPQHGHWTMVAYMQHWQCSQVHTLSSHAALHSTPCLHETIKKSFTSRVPRQQAPLQATCRQCTPMIQAGHPLLSGSWAVTHVPKFI